MTHSITITWTNPLKPPQRLHFDEHFGHDFLESLAEGLEQSREIEHAELEYDWRKAMA